MQTASSSSVQQVALIADIGGTHARFALLLPDQSVVETRIITDPQFTDCIAVCEHYLSQLPAHYTVDRAAWAVAGPITDDRITITNRGWTFSKNALQQHFGWTVFHTVNDFAALALSLPHLTDDDTVVIKAGQADLSAPLCVIGPGTGLGVAGLVPLPDRTWHVLPGEGGHVVLPAVNTAETKIVQALQDRFGYVAAEHVLSGRGLVALAQVMEPANSYDTPNAVVAAAQAGDTSAFAILDQFCAFLGSVAGDAALTLGARGGVYLAGGILPRIVEILRQSPFHERFNEKYAVKTYMDAIPVRLITHPLPAFVGLTHLLNTKKVN